MRNLISEMPIYSPNPMCDHLLESSHRDDSNKWSNIGFGQELKELASIEIHFTHLICRSDTIQKIMLVKSKCDADNNADNRQNKPCVYAYLR